MLEGGVPCLLKYLFPSTLIVESGSRQPSTSTRKLYVIMLDHLASGLNLNVRAAHMIYDTDMSVNWWKFHHETEAEGILSLSHTDARR